MEGGQKVINFSIGPINYNPHFKIFLICNLPNPHYQPETLTKVTLINFTITPEAAKDQMLSILSKEEDEALENEKIRLMGENADNKKKMAYVEKVILDLMSKT